MYAVTHPAQAASTDHYEVMDGDGASLDNSSSPHPAPAQAADLYAFTAETGPTGRITLGAGPRGSVVASSDKSGTEMVDGVGGIYSTTAAGDSNAAADDEGRLVYASMEFPKSGGSSSAPPLRIAPENALVYAAIAPNSVADQGLVYSSTEFPGSGGDHGSIAATDAASASMPVYAVVPPKAVRRASTGSGAVPAGTKGAPQKKGGKTPSSRTSQPNNPTLGGSAATARRQCSRPSPSGGTCKTAPLPGKSLCHNHTCPECGASKSSSASGCPAHAYDGFGGEMAPASGSARQTLDGFGSDSDGVEL